MVLEKLCCGSASGMMAFENTMSLWTTLRYIGLAISLIVTLGIVQCPILLYLALVYVVHLYECS